LVKGEALSDSTPETPPRDYFRRDRNEGISPPDLSKDCSFAEHIVHARGKRTQFTSVSLDPAKVRDFGEAIYVFDRVAGAGDNHLLVEHETLMEELHRVAQQETKVERARAIQAFRYAGRRREGLVRWGFDIQGIARKDLINWAHQAVQKYFRRKR
jgi:hypothetical protein